MHECPRCHRPFPDAEFSRRTKDGSRPAGWCKECRTANSRAWLARQPAGYQAAVQRARRARDPAASNQVAYASKKRRRGLLTNPISEKLCPKCGLVKAASEFGGNVDTRNGLRTYCKTCASEYAVAWNKAHPDRFKHNVRTHHLRKRYGLSRDEFDAMLASQGGRCAICRTDNPGSQGAWHVDHNHDTGANRGILCSRCNRSIGAFEDSADLLEAAAKYLRGTGEK